MFLPSHTTDIGQQNNLGFASLYILLFQKNNIQNIEIGKHTNEKQSLQGSVKK